MIRFLPCVLLCVLFAFKGAANYVTPGTGVKLSLNQLVSNAAGDITFSGGIYSVHDTIVISASDTLEIVTNETVQFAQGTYLGVSGVLLVNPPDSVVFTKADATTYFLGVWLDNSTGSKIRKLVLQYANSLRLSDSSPVIDSCIFRYNSPVLNFGNAAISLFRAKPTISHCQFISNQRAAISGGSNIANAPQVYNCLFMGNNTMNLNVPQINIGTTGADTARIMFNQILRASTNSGGLGFLPTGNVHAIVHGNVIKNNRYGMVFNGGANINALITYNQIDSNNTQNDPLAGGSGINFLGGTATSHQNSIVTGNLIRWNLWGVTIQTRAQPNLGNLTNSDTADDGKNHFIDNTNGSTPFIDLYNNTPDNIWAQGNYWGTDDLATIESKIFHQPDSAALGLVTYSNYIVPVQLAAFYATAKDNDVHLTWCTVTEANSKSFEVERSFDGRSFTAISTLNAAGTSNAKLEYSFLDRGALLAAKTIYYRLKQVDADGNYKYSNVISIKAAEPAFSVKVYPTVLKSTERATLEIRSTEARRVQVSFVSADGKSLSGSSFEVMAGTTQISLPLPASMVGHVYLIVVNGREREVRSLLLTK